MKDHLEEKPPLFRTTFFPFTAPCRKTSLRWPNWWKTTLRRSHPSLGPLFSPLQHHAERPPWDDLTDEDHLEEKPPLFRTPFFSSLPRAIPSKDHFYSIFRVVSEQRFITLLKQTARGIQFATLQSFKLPFRHLFLPFCQSSVSRLPSASLSLSLLHQTTRLEQLKIIVCSFLKQPVNFPGWRLALLLSLCPLGQLAETIDIVV